MTDQAAMWKEKFEASEKALSEARQEIRSLEAEKKSLTYKVKTLTNDLDNAIRAQK